MEARRQITRVLRRPPRAESVVTAILVFAALNVLMWGLLQPPAAGADERAYMDVTRFIHEEGRFPVFGTDPGMGVEARPLLAGHEPYAYRSYADRPGGPFLLSAVMLEAAPSRSSAGADYRWARSPGALYGVLAAMFVFLAARAAWPDRPILTVFAALVPAAWPQVTITMASLNDDGYTIATCAAVICCWYRGTVAGWPLRWCAAIGVAAGFVLLGKPTGYIMLVASLVVAVATLRGTWRRRMSAVFVAIAAMAVTSGWRIAIAVDQYGLDLFNTRLTGELMEQVDARTFPASETGISFLGMLIGRDVVTGVGAGAWPSTVVSTAVASVSFNRTGLPTALTLLIGGIVAAVFLHVMLDILSNGSWVRAPRSVVRTVHLIGAGTGVAYALALAWRNYTVDYIPHGQYLFPAFGIFALGFAGAAARYAGTARRARILFGLTSIVMLYANYRALVVLRDIHHISVRSHLDGPNAILVVAWAAAALTLVTMLIWWHMSAPLTLTHQAREEHGSSL